MVFFYWSVKWPCGAAVDYIAEVIEDVDAATAAGDCQRVVQGGGPGSGAGAYCQPASGQGYVTVDALIIVVELIRTVALILGKVNFTRLSRYGGRTAKTFASNFKPPVDWMKVNIGMAQDCFGQADDIAVVIDSSFISKAGRLT